MFINNLFPVTTIRRGQAKNRSFVIKTMMKCMLCFQGGQYKNVRDGLSDI